MVFYECSISKDSEESLIVCIKKEIPELPEVSWSGFSKDNHDWEAYGEEIPEINEYGSRKLTVYVLKGKRKVYLESPNTVLPLEIEIEFFNLGGLLK